MASMHQIHKLDPIFDSSSKILILGSFPSEKSREEGFYYAHKSNRFWPLMESLFDSSLKTVDQKKDFLLSQKIALWDVVGECDIKKSSDSTIKDVKPNDLNLILLSSSVEHIFLNGSTAFALFEKYNQEIKIPYSKLPSTSSANASFTFTRLFDEWKIIRSYVFQ